MSSKFYNLFHNKCEIKSENVGPIVLKTAALVGVIKKKLVILTNGDMENIAVYYNNQKLEIKSLCDEYSKLDFGYKSLFVFNKRQRKLNTFYIKYNTKTLYKVDLKINLWSVILASVYNTKNGRTFFDKLYYFLKLFYQLLFGLKYLTDKKKFLLYYSRQRKLIGNVKRSRGFIETTNRLGYEKFLENESFDTSYEFTYKPLISILIPVYNVPVKYLKECINSVLNQTYQNFEICICDDASTNEDVIICLQEFEEFDERIKVVYNRENSHISSASNSALKLCSGEFVGLLDNDDLLSKHALSEVVKALNFNKELDFIYSDEDKIDLDGKRFNPNFKPDYSPDLLISCNYICHFSVLRTSLIRQVGGFEVGLEGVQDHDLFLKVVEKTSNIYHIPKILYHWRIIEGSTGLSIDNKEYIRKAGHKMITQTLKRRNLAGKITNQGLIASMYVVDYENSMEKVSIIIPTKDSFDVLKVCLESIYNKTTYSNFEIILVDNGTTCEKTLKLILEYENKDNFKTLKIDKEFNYSLLNNEAAKIASGDYLLLLNNDVEVITPNWIELMLGYARQSHVGCVGAKLYYPNDLIQHNGVVGGLYGIAGHTGLLEEKSRVSYNAYSHLPTNYLAVTAACLMVSKKIFFEVGLLDERNLTIGFNDVDFCIRVYNKGYYNLVNPKVELYHYESFSRGLDNNSEKKQRSVKEMQYMYENYKEYICNDPFYNQNFSLAKPYYLETDNRYTKWKQLMENSGYKF